MGVKGLSKYILEICPPECTPEVSLLDILQEHQQAIGSYGQQEIVINGDSMVHQLHNNLDWVCGGEFLTYIEKLDFFVTTLYEKGLFPIFFFSGVVEVERMEYRLKKFDERRKHINHIFEKMKMNEERDSSLLNWEIIPPTIKPLTPFFLKYGLEGKCRIQMAVNNVDTELNMYARSNKCFAIMSEDTDNIIYPNSFHFLSVEHLDISTLKTLSYDRDAIAKFIGLKSVAEWPLFATLAGNEIVDRVDLLEFHATLCSQKVSKRSEKQKGFRSNNPVAPKKFLFPKLAEIVHEFPPYPKLLNYLEYISEAYLKDSRLKDQLKISILNYSDPNQLDPFVSQSHIFQSTSEPKVLQKARILHRNGTHPSMILSVLQKSKIVCPPVLEDLTLDYYQPANILLRPLRAKLYGILLNDKPPEFQFVVEYCCYNQRNIKNIECVYADLPESIPFPGLLKLWDPAYNSNDALSVRWKLFTSSISPRLEAWIFDLGIVPKQMIVPVATLFYLVDNCQLFQWEVAALISTFVLLPNSSSAEIDCLQKSPLTDPRAVSLASTVNLTIYTVITIFAACGFPSGYVDIAGVPYFDGKLFHSKYFEAKQGRLRFTNQQQGYQSQFMEIFHMLNGQNFRFSKYPQNEISSTC